jgi:hypothetical protein
MNQSKNPAFPESGTLQSEAASAKRSYTKPLLQTYGKLHQLTQSGSGLENEGASGMIGMK